MANFAGVDIGGTKIIVAIGDETGRLSSRTRLATAQFTHGPDALDAIADAIQALSEEAGIPMNSLTAIGIGCPGPLKAGQLLKTANRPTWEGLDIENGLHMRCGLPTFVENDATAAAIAESLYGAGKGAPEMIYVTVSTGIGAGIVVNGHRHAGVHGNAGELGHIVINPEGVLCSCGHYGCLETLASGTAIARMAQEQQQASPVLRQVDTVDASVVFAGALQGDSVCQAILQTAAQYLGLGLSYLVNLYNPQVIVLGGGVIVHHHEWLEAIRHATEQFSLAPLFHAVTIVPARLGADSGIQGAIAAAVSGHAFGSATRVV